MAYASTSYSSISLLARLGSALEAVRADFAKWRAYRATLAELRNLTSRELADLGLAAGGLKYVALEAVYGKLS